MDSQVGKLRLWQPLTQYMGTLRHHQCNCTMYVYLYSCSLLEIKLPLQLPLQLDRANDGINSLDPLVNGYFN